MPALAAEASVSFSAGTDSPVRAASSILSVLTATSRMSAGTLSPEANRTTSPGTRSAPATVAFLPSRRAVTFSGTILLSASIALPALNSCTKPISVLSTTTARMTKPFLMPSVGSTSIATKPEAIRTQISGELICRQSKVQAVSPLALGSTFGP